MVAKGVLRKSINPQRVVLEGWKLVTRYKKTWGIQGIQILSLFGSHNPPLHRPFKSRPRTLSILQIEALKAPFFLHKTLSMEICISLHPELRFFLVTIYIWSVFSLYLGARTCSRLWTELLKTWTLYIWQQTSRKFGDIQYICNRYTLRTFVPEVMDARCRNLDSKITHDFLQKLQCCTFLDQVTYTLRA
mgnify:CR=1 FL=1